MRVARGPLGIPLTSVPGPKTLCGVGVIISVTKDWKTLPQTFKLLGIATDSGIKSLSKIIDRVLIFIDPHRKYADTLKGPQCVMQLNTNYKSIYPTLYTQYIVEL